jgi:hypothetical protein
MKTPALLFALALLATPAFADWVIESKIESPQMNTNSVIKVKGDKVRADLTAGPMGAMSSIIDTTSGDSVSLIHAQKMAMKMSAAQMKQAMEMAKQASGVKGEPAKPKATGQKEKVGDYECEIWTWQDGDSTAKYWVATNHPQAAALKEVMKKTSGGALSGVQAGPDTTVFPGPTLKTEMTAAGTKTTMTVLSIKEQAVDAKEFDVPADYNAIAMPGAK